MAHVYKAPNGKGWYCRWDRKDPNRRDENGEPKRVFQKQVFRTREEALAKKRDIEERKASGLPVDHNAGKQTVRYWANEWHRHYARTVKPSTAIKSRGLLDATVIPLLGHHPIRDLDAAAISDWLDDIEQTRTGHGGKPISPATIRHHYLVLSNVLAYATTARAIPFNPARDTKPPTNKARGRRPRKYVFLNPADVSKLAEELPHPNDLLVQFLAFTGLRVGEAAGLNIADVDLDSGTVWVERTRTKQACTARCGEPTCTRGRNVDKRGRRVKASRTTDGRQAKCPTCVAACTKGECCWREHVTKNGDPRAVPIPAALAGDLRAYLAQHPHADDPTAPFWPGRKIVSRTRSGSISAVDYDQPWSPSVFYKRWFKPAVAAADLPPLLRLHDLRHSFASICASAGIPAAQVAEWMGHQDETVTRKIYTHMFKEDTSRHADALSAAFRPASRPRDELAQRRAERGTA